MKRISSTATTFYKKVFPALWFGFLALFVATTLITDAVEASPMFLVVPCVLAVAGYFAMKYVVWDLVDEVYDCDDFLLVRNRGQEQRVPLTEIMNVSAVGNINPPRITLRLTDASASGPLGTEIAFLPERPFTLNPFAKIPVAEDLIVRVDRARSRRAV